MLKTTKFAFTKGPVRAVRVGLGLAGACAAFTSTNKASASPVFDAINPNATPAIANNTYVSFGSKDVGWYYTPSTSFDLDGISTRFLGLASVAPSSPVNKTITVEIRTERPVNGGSVLRQGSFTVNLAAGGDVGGIFAPIRLSAGTRYFVDLLNVEGVGINLATWVDSPNGNPTPGGGATVNLGAWYRNFNSDTDFAWTGAAYGQASGSNGTVNVAGGSPILFFSGTTVPEPSSGTVLVLAAGALLRRRRKHV